MRGNEEGRDRDKSSGKCKEGEILDKSKNDGMTDTWHLRVSLIAAMPCHPNHQLQAKTMRDCVEITPYNGGSVRGGEV